VLIFAAPAQPSTWDQIRDWLIAVGTVGAVIVALGLAWWSDRKARRRRPLLSLGFAVSTGVVNELVTYTSDVTMTGADGLPYTRTANFGTGPAAYVRFDVRNARGRDAAEDVEVLLSRIERPSSTSETATVEISFPPFGWTHLQDTKLTMPPGITRSVDIGWLQGNPPKDLGFDPDVLELLVRPAPGNGRNLLPPGTYELYLSVAARNADAVDYVARISFSDAPNPHDPSARINVVDPPRPIRERDEEMRGRHKSRWFGSARNPVGD
jgi:hypothetical protein